MLLQGSGIFVVTIIIMFHAGGMLFIVNGLLLLLCSVRCGQTEGWPKTLICCFKCFVKQVISVQKMPEKKLATHDVAF